MARQHHKSSHHLNNPRKHQFLDSILSQARTSQFLDPALARIASPAVLPVGVVTCELTDAWYHATMSVCANHKNRIDTNSLLEIFGGLVNESERRLNLKYLSPLCFQTTSVLVYLFLSDRFIVPLGMLSQLQAGHVKCSRTFFAVMVQNAHESGVVVHRKLPNRSLRLVIES
jgi:hypothetical protein